MTTRPRLLFLCQTLPYPPDGGVWIRTYHVMRLLAETFDITALCFERASTAGMSAGPAIDGLRRWADVEVFRLPHKHHRLRFAWDHARSLASGRVYTTFVYDSRAFADRLAAHIASTSFDLVHMDSLDLARYLPVCRGIPVACVHHDVESDLLRRRSEVDPSRVRRWYLAHQSRLMRRVERRCCGSLALNVAVSERDRARILAIAPDARVAVVPNGVDLNEFEPGKRPRESNRDNQDSTPEVVSCGGIAFVGGTQPSPNFDALEYFCREIQPHLRDIAGDVPVRWIGRASPEQQRHYRQQHGVELTGYVDDVRPLMQAAACHIVPLRIGGGTRLKILNAWAMGKAVVSTSIGCEGLAAVDGENLLMRDEPRAFATAIASVLGSETLRARLGRYGRETVRATYDWNAVGAAMRDAYLSIARGGPYAAPAEGAMRHAITCSS